jgi:helix-turn-helix protein
MTRPVSLPAPGVYVPADVASVIAPTLERALEHDRAIGVRVHPDTAEAIERLALLGDAYRNRHSSEVSPTVSSVDSAPSVAVEWLSTADAADLLGPISPQAVTGLCRRGSLHAEQDGRTWRVCRASVVARPEGDTCRH